MNSKNRTLNLNVMVQNYIQGNLQKWTPLVIYTSYSITYRKARTP